MPEPTPITKLVDMDADEGVHAVTSPANGMSFVMIKARDDADGLTDDQAFAKALHEYTAWVKAKYTNDQIEAMGKKGQAFKNPDGHYSYPIADEDDLSNAIRAVGRGGADHDSIRAYIIKRAKALGLSSKIPETWGADGSMSKDAADFLSMTNPAGSTTPAAGDASVPGSPAWEADDAAALTTAGTALAQIAQMIECSAQREQIEVANGATDDIADVWDLQDALCYVNQALGIIARVAFTEQAEAGETGMTKSLTDEQHQSIRKTVDLLQRLDGTQLSGSAGEPNKEDIMSMTPEALAELVKSTVDEAITKVEEDRKAAKAEKKLAKAAAAGETEAEITDPETGEEVKKSKKDKAGSEDIVAQLGAVVKETVDAAVAPLKEQVDQFSKTAAPGGPLASASAARTGNPMVDVAPLEEAFSKETDPVKKADLGERLTKMRYLAKITGADQLERPAA